MQDLLNNFDRLRLFDETVGLGVLSNLCRCLRPRDRGRDVGLSAHPAQRHGGRRHLEATRQLTEIVGDAARVHEEAARESIVP